MIPGEFVGVRTGNNNWLYCEVQEVDYPNVKFLVINGWWEFTMNIMNNSIHGREDILAKIEFTGYIPPKYRKDYNDAIDYMEWAYNHKFQRYLSNIVSILPKTFGNIKFLIYRFKKSTEAFKNAWNNPHKLDDDIPF